jgi:hypothetical protein
VFEARLPDLRQVLARLVRHRALGAVGADCLRRVQLPHLMKLGYALVNEAWRLSADPQLVKGVEPVRAGERRR